MAVPEIMDSPSPYLHRPRAHTYLTLLVDTQRISPHPQILSSPVHYWTNQSKTTYLSTTCCYC
ncbi:unnamed protein product [Tenebrio molitor]|nr:unnamed protein product [Tenebrio molitor]